MIRSAIVFAFFAVAAFIAWRFYWAMLKPPCLSRGVVVEKTTRIEQLKRGAGRRKWFFIVSGTTDKGKPLTEEWETTLSTWQGLKPDQEVCRNLSTGEVTILDEDSHG